MLSKLKKWNSWECEIERKISDILIKYGVTKNITLQYVKAHSEVGYNCFIDELINATWKQTRTTVGKLKITDAPKTHDEVMNLVKKKMSEDEETTRRLLKTQHESISSRNLCSFL